MHAQIRNVISRLAFIDRDTVVVELSAGEQSPLGRLLYRLYYQTKVMDVVDRESRFGYPHNGGEHTFSYRGKPLDAVATLEMFKEELEKFNLTEEESRVANQLSFVSQEILAGRRKV